MSIIKEHLFPGRIFASKQELLKELRLYAAKLIAIKKATIYKSFEKGIYNSPWFNPAKVSLQAKADIGMKDDFIYPIINTTNYLDSHDDVHWPTLWNKTVMDQKGKIFYAADHTVKIDSIIAWPADVNMMIKSIPWNFVGKDYPGETEALIYEINKNAIVNQAAKEIIDNNRPVQNSVRMQYVTLNLGIDSSEKEDKKYKDYFDSNIDRIANKELAQENGYFFGIEQAKIVLEGSMVIRGSNDATSILQKLTEAEGITSEDQPLDSTDKTMAVCGNCGKLQSVSSSGSQNCVSCGQYISANSTQTSVPLFDMMKAIKETTFLKH